MVELVSRPEWLLDGWEQVCLLWRCSKIPDKRRAVLTEMAQLVPVMPREMAEWVTVVADPGEHGGQTISLNKDWRTGIAVLNLTARNEHLRALTT